MTTDANTFFTNQYHSNLQSAENQTALLHHQAKQSAYDRLINLNADDLLALFVELDGATNEKLFEQLALAISTFYKHQTNDNALAVTMAISEYLYSVIYNDEYNKLSGQI